MQYITDEFILFIPPSTERRGEREKERLNSGEAAAESGNSGKVSFIAESMGRAGLSQYFFRGSLRAGYNGPPELGVALDAGNLGTRV